MNTNDPIRLTNIRFLGNVIVITLTDSREISVPIDRIQWLNWLVKATPKKRNNWCIEPGGFAVYWPDLDDGLEIGHLLSMQPIL